MLSSRCRRSVVTGVACLSTLLLGTGDARADCHLDYGGEAPRALREAAIGSQDALRAVIDHFVDLQSVVIREAGHAAPSKGYRKDLAVWFRGTQQSSATAGGIPGELTGFDGMIGTDVRISRWRVGMIGSVEHANRAQEDSIHDNHDRRIRGGAYTYAELGRSYIVGAVSGGAHVFTAGHSECLGALGDERPELASTTIDDIHDTGMTRYRGRDVSAMLEYGSALDAGWFAIQLFGGAKWEHVESDAFTEGGDGATALEISALSLSNLGVTAGVRARPHRSARHRIVPRAELRYVRQLTDRPITGRAAFVGQRGSPFVTTSPPEGLNAWAAAGGFAADAGRAVLSLEYRAWHAMNRWRHTVALGLAF